MYLFVFLAALGLHCCKQVFSSCIVRVTPSLIGDFSCCPAQALGPVGFRSCSTWAQCLRLLGPRAWTQQLWCRGLVALQHVGSSQIRNQTCVSCVDWQADFFATEPPGKPYISFIFIYFISIYIHIYKCVVCIYNIYMYLYII